jgi:hypothetical protein
MSSHPKPPVVSRLVLLAMSCVVALGCARGAQDGTDTEGFGGTGGTGAGGTNTGGTNTGGTSAGGTGGTNTGGTNTGGTGGAAPGCHLVVNEIMTASSSSASDELVELFNPCGASVNLTGQVLAYRSAAGTTDVTLFSFTSGSVAAGGYLLIVGSAWSGGGQPDGSFAAGGLAAAGGGVALRDATDTLVDSVGYGTATNDFVEGTVAAAPAVGQSIGRSPNGVDTNDNAANFVTFSVPTPKAPNG